MDLENEFKVDITEDYKFFQFLDNNRKPNEKILGRLEKSIKETGITTIAIAGGVSANSYLRERLSKLQDQKKYNIFIPKLEYCTDNAAMIAIAGLYKYNKKEFSLYNESASARLSF